VTIAAEREGAVSGSERLEERKRAGRRKVILGVFGIFLGVLVVAVGIFVAASWSSGSEVIEREVSVRPTVVIVDENGGSGGISGRVLEFVARLEEDVAENGLNVDHVVLPFAMLREIDVYVVGRGEYYKMIIDRSSAEQAEDMGRMARWLEENGVVPEYVDLRVRGRAYISP
jgi:hypothetical protein